MKFSIKNYRRAWRTRKVISGMLHTHAEVKLEIGSGPVKGKNGWKTLDINEKSDLYWDLRETLPFPDNSIDIIYSSHVLEHFYYSELIRILKDCQRILKPRGIMSVCVPDASIYIRGYSNLSTFDREKYCAYKPAVISESRMDILNYIAYMNGNHRYMFDNENLIRILSSMGFISVRIRDFDPTVDMEARKDESIYAMGIKP
jgi:predicted SAM-dependent methyltransferase